MRRWRGEGGSFLRVGVGMGFLSGDGGEGSCLRVGFDRVVFIAGQVCGKLSVPYGSGGRKVVGAGYR